MRDTNHKALIVIGLGFGVLFNNNLIVQESVPKAQSGIALSTITLFQSIGMTIGVSIHGSLLPTNITSGVRTVANSLPRSSAKALVQATNGNIPQSPYGRLPRSA
ncbi:hypothetical protein [Alicyclobacillus fastidiosus]|uniref:Major facilitator superfamily (MFS) profile domain-containing protein n=1 Tax=Alicyclobacillus fastidiosus TaxID=392011 RepID=A0ABV5AJQ4_9BACL|nr:hypothetical protein [Alicyclobacillus fastidiosus]WEH08011.1 hypothetical protein PYS47_14770 [Alicyclobacillus fastidiosus]